jgi:hypothetical protein
VSRQNGETVRSKVFHDRPHREAMGLPRGGLDTCRLLGRTDFWLDGHGLVTSG